MGTIESTGRLGQDRVQRFQGNIRPGEAGTKPKPPEGKGLHLVVNKKLEESCNSSCDFSELNWDRKRAAIRDAATHPAYKAIRGLGIGAAVIILIVTTSLSPFIFWIVRDTNEVVTDTNTVVRVLTTEEQQKHDIMIIQDITSRYEKELIYFSDHPEEFKEYTDKLKAKHVP